MYHFSEPFLKGLKTKSDHFQEVFYEIIDEVCTYIDSDDEKRNFQAYIEAHLSYDKPGNLLCSTSLLMGGKQTDYEALHKKIHFYLLGLFDNFEFEEPMSEASHIIVCISAPKDAYSEKDMHFIQNLLSFERFSRGLPSVSVKTISNDTLNEYGASCFVAMLK